jgi:hypothetical protein
VVDPRGQHDESTPHEAAESPLDAHAQRNLDARHSLPIPLERFDQALREEIAHDATPFRNRIPDSVRAIASSTESIAFAFRSANFCTVHQSNFPGHRNTRSNRPLANASWIRMCQRDGSFGAYTVGFTSCTWMYRPMNGLPADIDA